MIIKEKEVIDLRSEMARDGGRDMGEVRRGKVKGEVI